MRGYALIEDVTSKHYSSMGHIYKWLGSDEQVKQLWQNREALEKYLARLKELMEENAECEEEPPNDERSVATGAQ